MVPTAGAPRRSSRTPSRKRLLAVLDLARHSYRGEPGGSVPPPAADDRELPIVLATITGDGDFPAVISMLTRFLTHVGIPRSIRVVDDGSLTGRQRDTISSVSPLVSFIEPDIDPNGVAAGELAAYARGDAMGKKLALLVELSKPGALPAVYADTDVWFTDRGDHLREVLSGPIAHPMYMCDDSTDSLDSRSLPEDPPHANSGFVILSPGMDWDSALERSRPLIIDPEWFTEQTVVHWALRANGAEALPPDRYLLCWDDRRSFRDLVHGERVVLRHYVTPVRHKYWVLVHGGYRATLRAVLRYATGDRRL